MKTVIDRLESEWHRAALARNLESINGRQQEDGYFPESLTGTYPGMFPRTLGALARLWSLTGDWDRLAASVAYVFQARRDRGASHLISPARRKRSLRSCVSFSYDMRRPSDSGRRQSRSRARHGLSG